MALILNLETATKICSVSLAKNGIELNTVEIDSENYSHSENLNLFIESLFSQVDFELKNIDAIAVSEGPGSYTGLRIGTSTAKGIAYALDIPIIAINSLKALAKLKSIDTGFICPMFDARRMEVYSAIFDNKMSLLAATEAKVIDDNSYLNFLEENQIIFLGPGAEKCQELIQHENAIFDLETKVSAKGMIALSEEKFNKKDFEDLAYFEPFYLKDFVAGPPKKLL